jgi:serine/threonine protein kinase
MTGDTLNHYRVERALGRGGMGEVYVAEDTRLHRKVALKVLPPGVGADPERRQRFEREAQTVAALNHPNIVTIFSVEQAGHVQFITMELVEGRTLAEVLPSDGLPIATLLQYAVPLADAVSAAHTRGIVHRDLKPANVMVTADGRIKVLDFGLAKLKEPVDAGTVTTMATDPLTGEGRIVGTAAYMSPEQAEGRPVDQRSDIFSIGVLLYEMAAGERPFKGETSLSLLSSIIKDTPLPINEVKPALPRELGQILRRCLAKDPARRYQSALDLRNELEEIKQELDSGKLALRSVEEGPRAASPRRRGTVWIGLGVAIGLFLAAGLAYRAWGTSADRPALRVERFQLQPPSGIRLAESGAASVLAISPDGQWIAFEGIGDEHHLYLRSTGEVEARRVGAGSSPFFSADSRWLGFFDGGFLQRIPVGGGQPQRICEAPRLRGASWGSDDMIVFSAGEGLLRVSSLGGTPETLTAPAPGERHYWPQVLPGHEAILFTLHQGIHDRHRKVATLSLKTGKIVVFDALSGSSARYVPGDHLIFNRSGTLYRVGFDPTRLQVRGEPRVVLDDVYFYGGSGFAGFDVASSGALVYMPGADRIEDTELVWLDRQGNATPLSAPRRPYRRAVLSPDGTRLAVVIAASHEDQDLWLHDIARDGWTRLTYGRERLESQVWSPDGRWIVFTSFKSGHGKLFRIPVDGGTPEPLTSGVEWDYPGGVTPDGTTVVFMRLIEASQWDLMTVRLDAPAEPVPFLSTRFLEAMPALSRDGRWVAYESLETGTRQVHVRPFPGPGPRVTVSTSGGWRPFWSYDGREMFYRQGQEVWAVAIAPGVAFSTGAPRLLFTAEFMPDSPWEGSLTVAPDGRFLAVRPPRRERTERLLVYVPNWRQELN